ncbi:hypothetical protein [Bradyrhizobium sp. Ash2021]|uniref:hypothetical protein n=1 Tax=Bradyrhizobium sp. Ash2021 TaxID=2954771 RepID=UPI00281590CC|nr:hypothetical protein [Bradyrhizobium sp. Ash2021]WMT78236.1 hypothetical protein NL528_18655 [Bradyrhizobium sp. Ash2021]
MSIGFAGSMTVRSRYRCVGSQRRQVRRIEIILAGNSNQSEQRIAPGRAAPIRCGALVSLTGHTGQSDEIHSPDECASVMVSRINRAASSIAVV